MRKAIAVDFDGCLCEEAWPEIGAPHMDVINAAIVEQRNGAALILWTCRTGELLDKAVLWCKEHGLVFDAVNENLPERLEHYGSESRKVSADEYWDDRAVHTPKLPNPPLTLEELREMDREPVWVVGVTSINKFRGHWDICDWENGKVVSFPYCMENPDIGQYGITWRAYRRRPEEGTDGT